MLSESKKNRKTELVKQPNRINQQTKIKGDIISSCDFRIDGELEGTIETTGKVVIGKEGYINGKVLCAHIDIEGNFNGELQTTGLLTLKTTANVEGTVEVAKLAVEPGATFNATCSMKNTAVKMLKDEQTTTEKIA